ncbi:AAA family ATPase [Maridesulfovibrio sp.]|uniref:AAA family ATPase n=1 Tax=unclassified Maridesulfovibrio TaxID=2794999 RepID=UPI003B003171
MKLLIENFYNIKHAELDFKKFNILIGPQAAGKSLIAKVLYFFEESLLTQNLEETFESDTHLTQKKILDLFNNIFETHTLSNDFGLTFTTRDDAKYTITSEGFHKHGNHKTEKQTIIETKQFIEKALDESVKTEALMTGKSENEILGKRKQNIIEDIQKELIHGITTSMGKIHIFIPASRSLVNIIADNSFWVDNDNIDILLKRFGRIYSQDIHKLTKNDSFSCPPLNDVLKGKIYKLDKKYIVANDSNAVSLGNASSGQQAVIPLVVALNSPDKRATHKYIEEPEAHIFPAAQQQLIKYIAKIHNNELSMVTLTTHSPYILTATNTLIYAGTVGKQSEEKAAKVREIIPEDQWLNAEDVAACMVEADGSVRSIFDEETGLIDADSIDDVSDVIGSEFNKILDIEFEEEAGDA